MNANNHNKIVYSAISTKRYENLKCKELSWRLILHNFRNKRSSCSHVVFRWSENDSRPRHPRRLDWGECNVNMSWKEIRLETVAKRHLWLTSLTNVHRFSFYFCPTQKYFVVEKWFFHAPIFTFLKWRKSIEFYRPDLSRQRKWWDIWGELFNLGNI